jgi:hypothetical protein
MRAIPVVLMIILAVRASAGTILVDAGGAGDFLTIQDGIDAASFGDTVAVMPGVYDDWHYVDMHDPMGINAAVVTMRDGIALVSTAGPDYTLIEGVGLEATVYFDNCGPQSSISGFSIDLQGYGYGLRTGILCYSSSPVIESNELIHYGIFCTERSSATIRNNTLRNSDTGYISFGNGSGGLAEGNTVGAHIGVWTTTQQSLPVTIESNIVGLEEAPEGRSRESIGIGVSEGGPGEAIIRDNLIRGKDVGAKLCRGTLRHNRFVGNVVNLEVRYYCDPWTDIDAESNWWGTADPEEIEAKIVDCWDDPALESCVDFIPWCMDEDCTQTAASASSWGAVKVLFR